METINIKGLDKSEVLAALYNNAKPQGMGFLHYDPTPMTKEQASELLEYYKKEDPIIYFDYLKGRVMKIRISEDSLNPRLYDRDNGQGACLRAIQTIKS